MTSDNVPNDPAPDPWDAAIDLADAPERARDEAGRFVSADPAEEPAPEAEAAPPTEPEQADLAGEEAPEQPAAEPTTAAERRAFKIKVDHEEREIDLDAEWADESRRAKLRETWEKGLGFDRVVGRTRQEAHTQGRDQTLAWIKSQGYDIVQNPMTGQWTVVPPQQVATPAGGPPASAATPSPTAERARLEKIATYGDDNDPEGQIKAIRALARLDAEEAAKAKFREFEEWKDALARRAQEEHRARVTAQAEQEVRQQIETAIAARAKSFEGPERERQIERAIALAMLKARSDAKTLDDVLAVVNQAADDLDARREHWLRQAATPAPAAKKPPARKPTPSLDGVPAGATNGSPKSGKLTGWNDPRLDEYLS